MRITKILCLSLFVVAMNCFSIMTSYSQTVINGGYAYSMMICEDSTVWVTGSNSNEQLGDGTTTNKIKPIMVPGLSGVYSISTMYSHSVALLNDSTVWTWGWNIWGQLGIGTMGAAADTFTPIQVTANISNIVAISAGWNHTLALDSAGKVWAWGRNMEGQLGDNTWTQKLIPKMVPGLSNIVAIACGYMHSMALRSDSTVWIWGNNFVGQLGDGTTAPSNYRQKVTPITGIIGIAAGEYQSMALQDDGTLWMWGQNDLGQCGDGTNTGRLTPGKVTGLNNVIGMAGGQDHSIAVKNDGTVWTWGQNDFGQLGDSTTRDTNRAIQVYGLSNIVTIAAGGDHSMAIRNDGTAWIWGRNQFGQLGDSTTNDTIIPIQLNIGCTLPVICDMPTAKYGYIDTFLSVSFIDSSDLALSVLWDFGDGDTSTQLSPTHEYLNQNTYNVCQIVTNVCGSDTMCKLITTDCPNPISNFGWLSNKLTVNFRDSSENSTSWLWDYGDGNSDSVQWGNHVYDTAGTYKVCFTVANECNEWDSVCKIMTITDGIGIFENDADVKFIHFYPNPYTDNLFMNISLSRNAEVEISVINILGEQMFDEKRFFYSGTQNIELPIPKLPEGIYLIRTVVNGSENYSSDILKTE